MGTASRSAEAFLEARSTPGSCVRLAHLCILLIFSSLGYIADDSHRAESNIRFLKHSCFSPLSLAMSEHLVRILDALTDAKHEASFLLSPRSSCSPTSATAEDQESIILDLLQGLGAALGRKGVTPTQDFASTGALAARIGLSETSQPPYQGMKLHAFDVTTENILPAPYVSIPIFYYPFVDGSA